MTLSEGSGSLAGTVRGEADPHPAHSPGHRGSAVAVGSTQSRRQVPGRIRPWASQAGTDQETQRSAPAPAAPALPRRGTAPEAIGRSWWGDTCWLTAVPPDPRWPQRASAACWGYTARVTWCFSPCSHLSITAGNAAAPNAAATVPIADCTAATPGADPHPRAHLHAAAVLLPAPSKGAFDRKQTFFFPLVLPAHLSLARGRQSCQCLNLTHPFNLGGRNTFVPDNVHQMVARGAPVAAVPDGWATRALPDLCLYVICIAAGGFSSRRQLQHHLPGRSSSPGMAAGSSGQEGPGHTAAAGTTAPREAVSHRARGGERPPCPGEGLQAVPVPPAWLRWDWRDWDNPAGSRAGTCRAQGMEDALTTGSATSHGRRERSCCTCPLGDILPTRGPVTVTERVRSWAAQSPGDG